MTTRIVALIFGVFVLIIVIAGVAVELAKRTPHDQWDMFTYTVLDNGVREILITDISHDLTHQVTHFGALVDAPDWSPDGTKIAFHSSHERGGYKVYVIDLFTGTLTKINAEIDSMDQDPKWSPDSQRLAFIADDDNALPQVWMVDFERPDEPEVITNSAGHKSRVSWTPDGQHITFHAAGGDLDGRHVYFVDLNDGNKVTHLETNGVPVGFPEWSPDGEKLLFLVESAGMNDIMMMERSGDNVTFKQVTQTDTLEYYPRWSSDSKEIAFVRGGTLQSMGFYTEIYTLDIESGQTKFLYEPEGLMASPSWRR